jgi:MoaA/NifB/PqqE/SkfB family radical SAM enzyme
MIADTLMLSTKCTAGCSHCPFAAPSLPALHLSPAHVLGYFRASRAPLVVLSGGEPFEHPQIGEILEGLRSSTVPFRIATGGHIDLAPWIEALRFLPKHFQGISLGTDVLTSRVKNAALAPIWRRNLAALREAGIPFSITYTFTEEPGEEGELETNGAQFLYVRHPAHLETVAREWGAKFPATPLILDVV